MKQAIIQFGTQIGLSKEKLRVSDHQHLTYDSFAKDKGVEGTQVHKFRSMSSRYLADETNLPKKCRCLNLCHS